MEQHFTNVSFPFPSEVIQKYVPSKDLASLSEALFTPTVLSPRIVKIPTLEISGSTFHTGYFLVSEQNLFYVFYVSTALTNIKPETFKVNIYFVPVHLTIPIAGPFPELHEVL